MIFAGLWDHWKSPEGNLIESCTILTTTSNDLINHCMKDLNRPLVFQTRLKESYSEVRITFCRQLKTASR